MHSRPPSSRRGDSRTHIFSQRLRAALYTVPVETDTLEEWQRARSLDLASLATADLLREARRVQRRLDLEPATTTASFWLTDRLAMIRTEIARRRKAVA